MSFYDEEEEEECLFFPTHKNLNWALGSGRGTDSSHTTLGNIIQLITFASLNWIDHPLVATQAVRLTNFNTQEFKFKSLRLISDTTETPGQPNRQRINLKTCVLRKWSGTTWSDDYVRFWAQSGSGIINIVIILIEWTIMEPFVWYSCLPSLPIYCLIKRCDDELIVCLRTVFGQLGLSI